MSQLSLVPSPRAAASVEFDAALVRKMSQSGPRYTSYPTADRFTDAFGARDYADAVEGVRAHGLKAPLSLYVHIPFCESICYYCACNKVITRDHAKAATYLAYLKQEITLQGKLFEGSNTVSQLHLGGGTPTFFSDAQLAELLAHLRHWFAFLPDSQGEYAIEIDPRTVDGARIHSLRALGFNRLSLGVQDFDPDVQAAVNRIQPEQLTLDAIAAARAAGFHSVSIDLIYGLPRQNMDTMRATLDKVVKADPDRISIYSYAHLPHVFKPQRRIADADMPDAALKLEMLALCIAVLTAAGYVYIGMDHFAKPTDELALAQRQGRLHRNFQGYSTQADADLVAVGVSAISAVGASYSQNDKTLEGYYARLDEGKLPVARGIRLSADDGLRRMVIQMLMCQFELSMPAFDQVMPLPFADYFASELRRLQPMVADGLLQIDEDWLTVTPKGRLLIRNICMVFDPYLQAAGGEGVQPLRFSRTI